MKIRLVLVALVLAAAAACGTPPTAPAPDARPSSTPTAAFDVETPPDSTLHRGGFSGNGN